MWGIATIIIIWFLLMILGPIMLVALVLAFP
jgi:hypothetical protein